MDKFIFLDIDGVLNLESAREEKSIIYGSEEFFMNDIYDVRSMLNLKILIDKTNAQIILTSNRRIHDYCVEKFKTNLKLYEIENNYFGIMPIITPYEDIKCPAIKVMIDWYNIKNYIIFDDFEPVIQDKKLKESFICVSHKVGITKENIIQAIKLMEAKDDN